MLSPYRNAIAPIFRLFCSSRSFAAGNNVSGSIFKLVYPHCNTALALHIYTNEPVRDMKGGSNDVALKFHFERNHPAEMWNGLKTSHSFSTSVKKHCRTAKIYVKLLQIRHVLIIFPLQLTQLTHMYYFEQGF